MRNDLFIGTIHNINIDEILEDSYAELTRCGIQATPGDLAAWEIKKGSKMPFHGDLLNDCFLELSFRNSESNITMTQFETEIVPKYSQITDPLTICVSIWTGAEPVQKVLAACVAVALARRASRKILDPEHKWADVDLSDADDFIVKVAKQYSKSEKI